MSPNPQGWFSAIKDKNWADLPGYPGIQQILLAGTLDETAKKGHRTRLVRFAPGAKTDSPLIHDYHEEAYLISGDLCGIGEAANCTRLEEQAYVYRPPGTPHGPMKSDRGCVMLETHYYDKI